VTLDCSTWFDQIDKKVYEYRSVTRDQLNHAVLLYGFKLKKKLSKSTWLIKNSWSVRWGKKGYAKLRYGPDGNNMGICYATPYPIV